MEEPMNYSPHYWATPADRQTARDWYAAHFTLSESPGQSLNPHRVVWKDYVEQARLQAEAMALQVENNKIKKAKAARKNLIVHTRDAEGRLADHDNLTDAARYIGANVKHAWKLLEDGKTHCRGFKIWRNGMPEPADKEEKTYTLFNSELNKTVSASSYKELTYIIGAHEKSVWACIAGKQSHVAGWTLPGATGKKMRLSRPIYILDVDGNRTDFSDARKCTEFLGKSTAFISNWVNRPHGPKGIDLSSKRRGQYKPIPYAIYFADNDQLILPLDTEALKV